LNRKTRSLAPGTFLALAVVSTILLTASAHAQEPQPTLVRVGFLIDGSGDSPRPNVSIVVRDGRIVDVRAATPADAANRDAIDLSGLYVLPGLIDVHAHLTLSPDPNLDYGDLSAPASGIGVMHAERTLMAGFTTVRDPFGPYYADVALRDAIAAGWVAGPRLFVSGPALTMTGGHGAIGNWAPPELELKSTAVQVAGVFPHGDNAKQFALYVALGMSPMEVLQSAAVNAAELIGIGDETGTIEAGKRADLIAVASNPLRDIRQLEQVLFVMKEGVVVKNDRAP
jgi:imidazolonepropionase-like amidohydrolase